MKIIANSENTILEQAKRAWDTAIGESGQFIVGKMYPAKITMNGKTLNFGVYKQSGSGPLRLALLVNTKYGYVINHYKFTKNGEVVEDGRKNLFALQEDVREERIREYKNMFSNDSTIYIYNGKKSVTLISKSGERLTLNAGDDFSVRGDTINEQFKVKADSLERLLSMSKKN